MPRGDVLIAVDSVNKDIIAEAIFELSHRVDVQDGHTFFVFDDVEWDVTKDHSLISIQGALDEIGKDGYAFVRSSYVDHALQMEGNLAKFGVKGYVTYGSSRSEVTH